MPVIASTKERRKVAGTLTDSILSRHKSIRQQQDVSIWLKIAAARYASMPDSATQKTTAPIRMRNPAILKRKTAVLLQQQDVSIWLKIAAARYASMPDSATQKTTAPIRMRNPAILKRKTAVLLPRPCRILTIVVFR